MPGLPGGTCWRLLRGLTAPRMLTVLLCTALVAAAVPARGSIAQAQTSFAPIRINSGGGVYTDPIGKVWGAESGCIGGGNQTSAESIDGTDADSLYQSARVGVSACSYTVPNGSYTVTLKFVETAKSATNQRKFDVLLEGELAFNDLDIFAQAGGRYKALDRSAAIAVSDGKLNIAFMKVTDNPMVSAIEIVYGTSAPPPACTPTFPPPQSLAPGQAKTGAICPADQMDLFSFGGVAGQQARIQMTATAGSALQPYVELWDCCTGDGTKLAQSTTANHTIVMTLPYSGNYAVRAGSFNRASTGAYSLSLTLTTPQAAPALQTPGQRSDLGPLITDSLQPPFHWSAVGEASSYRIQIATSADLRAGAINATVGTTSYIMPSWQKLKPATQYWWHVQVVGSTSWSDTFTFKTPSVPGTPTLTAPVHGTTASSLTPTLDWASAANAPTTYHVQVASNSWFGTKVVDASVSADSSYTVPTALAPDTTYFWRVNAANGAGTSAYSPTWSFRTPPPDTPPTIAMLTPAPDATDVPVGADLTITFSEAMLPASISATTVSLKSAGGTPVPATVSYDAESRTARLNPTEDLLAHLSYAATVKGGSAGVRDLNGTSLAADRSWSFTTAVIVWPGPAALTVVDPLVQVGTQLYVSWSGVEHPSTNDWIGLFKVGDPDSATVSRQLTGGGPQGSLYVTMPTTAGSYEARLFLNNGTSASATSSTVWGVKLAAASRGPVWDRSAVVTWQGLGFETDGSIYTHIDTARIEGAPARPVPVIDISDQLPDGEYVLWWDLVPGIYEMTLRWQGRTGRAYDVATTRLLVPSITASSSAVAPGASIQACWAYLETPTSTDWFALYRPGSAPDASPVPGTRQNTDGTASGCRTMTMPAESGNYELRLFPNGQVPDPNDVNPIAMSSYIVVEGSAP
jgi:hypothetical protein